MRPTLYVAPGSWMDGTRVPPRSPAALAEAGALVQTAEALLSDGRTTLFDAWCIADSDFAFTLQRLNLSGHPLPAPVRACAEAQWARPSVRAFFAHPRPAP